MYGGSSILIEESSVYLFPGNNRDDARAIQRIKIGKDAKIKPINIRVFLKT